MEDKIDLMGKSVTDGDLKTVKELIGDNPELLNEITFFGSWLNRAATNGRLEVAQYLIDEGIDINKNSGVINSSPLGCAITTGKIDMVKLLVENNAVFDVSTKENNPLFNAISSKKIEIVKYLIEQGIDITVSYNINNKEQNAYIYSKYNGTEEITNFIAGKMKEKNIYVKEEKNSGLSRGCKANLKKDVLKDMFSEAIRKTVRENFEKHKDEVIYAMSFEIDYYSCQREEGYQCQVYMQTEKAYKEAGDEEDIADAKYIPDEYKYIEDGNDIFVKISKYLYENCTDDVEENCKIERILAETICELRKEGVFKNLEGNDVYVYPYPREETEDEQEKFIENAKLMNENMDINEFIEYLFEE